MRIIKYNRLLKSINNYLYDSKLSIDLNYYYGFGSILGLLLIIQLISGILLSMHYIATIELAFNSIEYIMRDIPYGYILRMTHANGATLFFIIVYLHIARAIKYNSYIKLYTWNIGIIIFLIMILTAFIGYSLVYGQMSYWAIAVITNILNVIPYFGKDIIYLIYGGYNINTPTLERFYTIHYLLPFILVGLSLLHLITLHSSGSKGPTNIISRISYINFNPYYTFKDIIGFISILLLLIYLVFFYPNFFNHSDNYIPANPFVTPTHIQPEIYLLPFYCMLRSIPHKTLGVLVLLSSIFILFILPYINYSIIIIRPYITIWNNILFFIFISLIYLGQAPLEYPYITIGLIYTILYFSYYLLYPLISYIESYYILMK